MEHAFRSRQHPPQPGQNLLAAARLRRQLQAFTDSGYCLTHSPLTQHFGFSARGLCGDVIDGGTVLCRIGISRRT